MAETHRFSVSVAGAVIDDQGRFLCIKRRDNGHWEPPGGLVEPGETLIEAVEREVREETGCTVKAGPVSGVYQNMTRDIVSIVFRCEVVYRLADGQAKSPTRVRWLTADEVSKLMDEAYASRLLDALRDPVIVRPHDGENLIPSSN